jgi:dihydroorotase
MTTPGPPPSADLVVRGGHLLDPGSGLDGPGDIVIADGRVTAIGPDVGAGRKGPSIDARNAVVTAGLVDLHAHVYAGHTYWGVDPDIVGPRTGVTTFVDAGSAGAYSLAGLAGFSATRRWCRVLAFANIAAGGLVTPSFELANIDHCDPAALEVAAAGSNGFVRGVKVRMGVPIALGHGVEPLRRARMAADRLDVPVMCHIAAGPPSIDAVIDELRPGDIITHALTGLSMRLTGQEGQSPGPARRARTTGILIDLGHGAGGFSFRSARVLADDGIWPDTISTDLHQLSMNGPMFDLPTCMTKMLALGMPLPDVIDAATRVPAKVIGLSDIIGRLAVGSIADIAIWAVDEGAFTLVDVHHETITATRRLRCLRTIVGGRVAPRSAPERPAPWVPLTDRQRAVYDASGPDTNLGDELAIEDLAPPLDTSRDPGDVLAEAMAAFSAAKPEVAAPLPPSAR